MPYDEKLAARMEKLVKDAHPAGFTSKKMFGGIAYMLQGNMACGVHKGLLIVRVGPDGYMDALNRTGARPFDLTGRPMSGWVSVTRPGFESDQDLAEWVRLGVEFAATLPPKK
jgi:TfoX/Sxy family transcriptional regulator of competence genes